MDHRVEELEQQVLTLQRRLIEAEAKAIRAEQDRDRVAIEAGFRDAVAKSATPINPAAMTDVLKRATTSGDWRMDPQHGLIRMAGAMPEITPDGRYVSPRVWLDSLQAEAPHLFSAPSTPADAAAAAGGRNPFDKTTWSLTEQGKLFQTNPELARKLAHAAGRTLDGV